MKANFLQHKQKGNGAMIRTSIKGATIGAGVLALLGLFFFGWDAASYVTTGVDRMTDSVRSNVPIEFEIDRARTMIKDLEPDIRQNMQVIAEEEVALRRLNDRIEKLGSQLDSQKNAIMTLRNDLTSEREVFVYANREYTQAQVKADLASRFGRFKTQNATLESLKKTRDARERSLSAARQKLDGMFAARRQLEVDVENLEAQLKMVEAAQTTASYQFDDSRLSRVKELVENLQTRLDVTAKLLDQETVPAGEIQLDSEVPGDVVDQVDVYFSDEIAVTGEGQPVAAIQIR